jgi:iron complex transport system substrate-binding protein
MLYASSRRAHWAPRALLLALLLAVLACAAPPPATPTKAAASVTVTDVVGRTVQVRKPVERMILGEARQLYLVAALEPEDPFKRIVAWPDDLRTADFDAYEKYKAKFPKLADVPVVGNPGAGQFSAEKAIELKPDVFVLNFDSYQRSLESGLIDQLAKAGIPTVVLDFRQYPLENTVPSTLLLGRLMGKEERAFEIADFYTQQLNVVYSRIDKVKEPKPTAFFLRAAGLLECCATFGRANLGLLWERAGGVNLGSELIPGWAGTLNPEKVLVADMDVVVATGSNWSHSPGQSGGWIRLGYGANPEESRKQLKELAQQPGWSTLKAVKSGRFHAVWHQFYNSPYHFAALQQFAKWAYPDAFKDVDPEANFKTFHEKFLPIEYGGAFWVSLGPS